MMLGLLLMAAAPVVVVLPADRGVDAAIATAGPGTRIGLVVVDEAGREIVAIRPDERFVPASNTKIFTTAVAFAALDMAAPDGGGGASVRLEGRDAILSGHGDARLSSAADCASDCLATLVAAVAARTRTIDDVIGDDSAFPDERWPSGMSWNNMAGRYGTAISALTIDDNVVSVTVTPGAAGDAARVAGDGYFRLDNRVTTGPAGGQADIGFAREPGSDLLRLTGTIPAGAAAETVTVGIDDPAHRAAWRFAAMLRAAGVKVAGRVGVRHRPIAETDDPAKRAAAPAPRVPEPPALARLAPPPLAQDVTITNKVSQNLHAELLLRRVGAVSGSGSVADGQAAVAAMMTRAGVPRWRYDFADGSGMASYNRVSPRATVALLRWIAAQPWAAAWRATLPVGGVDGTLRRRFVGTPLQGRVFAKTGTLNAANAVAGYLVAASGKTLTFAAYANDMPADASATAAIDAALQAVAARN